jgi:hypothetical protein
MLALVGLVAAAVVNAGSGRSTAATTSAVYGGAGTTLRGIPPSPTTNTYGGAGTTLRGIPPSPTTNTYGGAGTSIGAGGRGDPPAGGSAGSDALAAWLLGAGGAVLLVGASALLARRIRRPGGDENDRVAPA